MERKSGKRKKGKIEGMKAEKIGGGYPELSGWTERRRKKANEGLQTRELKRKSTGVKKVERNRWSAVGGKERKTINYLAHCLWPS